MKIFLAGAETYQNILDKYAKCNPYILSSFYYIDEKFENRIKNFGDFMLDSGAFTFMQKRGGDTKWEEYIERYADFVVRNRVEKFFELDIDVLVGYQKVLEYRDLLERKANRRCIPVWHKMRGMEEFKRMCDEFPYVAIGGHVIGELAKSDYDMFPAMIRYAHKHDARIHCLGYTNVTKLEKYHFDSVDSTRWNCARFGRIECFDGKTMRVFDWRKQEKRLKRERAADVSEMCFGEWLKFQRYADSNL